MTMTVVLLFGIHFSVNGMIECQSKVPTEAT